MDQGIDYSVSRPNLDTVKALGYNFVCRYLCNAPNPKQLTAAELADIRAHKLGLVLAWEQGAEAMKEGYATGLAHAQTAYSQARALGVPRDIPIYFACDFNATNDDLLNIRSYLRACSNALGISNVGIYGSAFVVAACVPLNATWGWQTYAWSGTTISPKAHIYQYRNGVTVAGADVDLNQARKQFYGAWKADMELGDTVWTAADGNTSDVPAGDRTVGNILASLDQRTSLLVNGGYIDNRTDAITVLVQQVLAKLPTSVGTSLSASDINTIANAVTASIKAQWNK